MDVHVCSGNSTNQTDKWARPKSNLSADLSAWSSSMGLFM